MARNGKRSLKILLVSSEVAPFAKTGGLADVSAALPRYLAQLGHDVRVVMPRYGSINLAHSGMRLLLPEVPAPFPGRYIVGKVYEAALPGADPPVPVYFIDCPTFFNRPGLYGEEGDAYYDNDLRFAFFSMASAWMLKSLSWAPDVVQCNDWQGALFPVFLKNLDMFRTDPFFSTCRILFAIHNMAYQGRFPAETLATLGLPLSLYHPDTLEFWGAINLLKGGILFSDRIVTVSPRYAQEIQTPEFGHGLDGLLVANRNRLSGILNGVDYADWNSETDPLIPRNYSPENLAGKAACKRGLQKKLGLKIRSTVPLIGMVTRLDSQKGLDLVREALPDLMRLGIQLAILGSGAPYYEDIFRKAPALYPGQLAVHIGFDNRLAHEIEAGSDAFLMPSLYEPCGLNQMYSLKYGTVPIVRNTGGLADTIKSAIPPTRKAPKAKSRTPLANAPSSKAPKVTLPPRANGFAFTDYTSAALTRAVSDAVDFFLNRPEQWRTIQATGMHQDFSWQRSAKAYEKLYLEMVGG